MAPPGIGLVLFAFEDQLVLARRVGTGYRELHSADFPSMSPDSLKVALRKIFESPTYSGQPVHVVAASDQIGVSYIRRAKDLSAAAVFETAKRLQDEATDLHIGYISNDESRILTIQCFDRDRVNKLLSALERLQVPVVSTITLATLELNGNTELVREGSNIDVVKLPGNHLFINTWQDGAFVYAIEKGNEDVEAEALSFSRQFLDSDTNPSFREFNRITRESSWLLRLPHLTKEPQDLFKRSPSYKSATTLRAVWNSLFAVSVLISAVAVVLLVFDTASWLSLDDQSDNIAQYQALYQQRQLLARVSDSLSLALAASKPDKKVVRSSAILSAFCQAARPDLYLNSITLTSPDPREKAILVSAVGTARSDQAVFSYFETTRPHLQPYDLLVDLVTPTIVSVAGKPDTAVQFRLQTRIGP